MKILNLSSGATKFIGIVAKAQDVCSYDGYKPDIITGISAGAIACLPVALGMWEEAMQKGLSVSASELFSQAPFDEKGKLNINFRSLINGSLGTQRVDKLIREVITEDLFFEYKKKKYPTCYVQAVNINTGQIKIWNLKQCGYEEALSAIAASAAIPIYTQAIKIDNDYFYDGGLRDTIIHVDNLNLSKEVKEVISIYSQPVDNMVLKPFEPSLTNMLVCGANTINIILSELRKNDCLKEQVYCESKKIKLTQYQLPAIMSDFYDMNADKLEKLYFESLKAKPSYTYLPTLKSKSK